MGFLRKVEGLLFYFKGDGSKGQSKLEKAFNYYLSIKDNLGTLECYLLILAWGKKENQFQFKTLNKQLEFILDENSFLVFKHTSLLHQQYFKIKAIKAIKASFLNATSFKIEGQDYSDFSLNRKKIRRILFFLLYEFPEPINREEIKRTFWNGVDSDGRDANLRVALSKLNKLLNEAGIESFYESRNGYIYLKSGYKILTDIKEFNLLYKRGGQCYQNEEFVLCQKYFKTLLAWIKTPFSPVGKEGSWEWQVETKVFKNIINMESIMLDIAMKYN
ncbi:hypothetical protein AZF37_06690 [endosymbiont 'TC1' of Trimyema compressum]|uniref:hypothetical protein n=1 Tax=endosymbiont 'TC1' of Trimyema compressum TaxID=243899 RepID=UPI0007F137DF|nr:hypothetical protein [endosymbiont 'TC1' of Trimyema compressum]AMP20889.1 hypothetical protein AZF37_06690 [endosymbiont 'TC1' of Trimyema compressum]